MIDLWYKNAVIYCLDVETFTDGNGDGVGDFEGLTERLDYLAGIGVTCVWLLPFYPSPDRDDGYDIRTTTTSTRASARWATSSSSCTRPTSCGIRVIVDLVVNHTSDQHPWFQAARSDPQSQYRDYYVWSKKKPKNADDGHRLPGRPEDDLDLRQAGARPTTSTASTTSSPT